MKTSVKVAPYDPNGNLLHYAWKHDERIDWRPNDPFRATMMLDSMRSGRSAKYVIWQQVENGQETGRYFPMFVTDLLVVATGGIGAGGIVIAEWMVAKRGQNYGLKVAPKETRP